MTLTEGQRRCHGLSTQGFEELDGHLLHPAAREAFLALREVAIGAGFDLRIASAHRSFERQRLIWNGKLSGLRPVFDDADCEIDLAPLDTASRIERVLRFSAMPGASRHHWGTDIDVYDGAAVADDYRLRLDTAEVAEDGPFGPLHRWLDERIAAAASCGFFRPYDRDRHGTAPERWHLSFAPAANACGGEFSLAGLRAAWREATEAGPGDGLVGQDELESRLEALVERFVMRVAPSPGPAAGVSS